MSIWCYSRWERLWGSGQIRRKEGSSRCWSRMMYCRSLWDSDNTSTKVEQGKGGKNWSLWYRLGEKPADSKESNWGGEGHNGNTAEKVQVLCFVACARFLLLKQALWLLCGGVFFFYTTVLPNSLWRDEVGNSGNLFPRPPLALHREKATWVGHLDVCKGSDLHSKG